MALAKNKGVPFDDLEPEPELAPGSAADVEMIDAPEVEKEPNSGSSTPTEENKEPDQDMRKVAAHIANPNKYFGLVGLLKSRVRNSTDQTVYETGVRQMFDSERIGNTAYLPDLVIRATDAMLHIIGADDEKEVRRLTARTKPSERSEATS